MSNGKVVPLGSYMAQKRVLERARDNMADRVADLESENSELRDKAAWSKALASGDTESVRQQIFDANVEATRLSKEAEEKLAQATQKENDLQLLQIAADHQVDVGELAGMPPTEAKLKALGMENERLKGQQPPAESTTPATQAAQGYDFGPGASQGALDIAAMPDDEFEKHIAEQKRKAYQARSR